MNLLQFAADVLETGSLPIGGMGGNELQEIAIKHGLVIPERRFGSCRKNCSCIGFYTKEQWIQGIICYRRVPEIVEVLRERKPWS
jgi:hypothetical protein